MGLCCVDWGGLDWTGRVAWGISLEGEEGGREHD
jgi:hypothetical protein